MKYLRHMLELICIRCACLAQAPKRRGIVSTPQASRHKPSATGGPGVLRAFVLLPLAGLGGCAGFPAVDQPVQWLLNEYPWQVVCVMVFGTLGALLVIAWLVLQRVRAETRLVDSEEWMKLAVVAAGLGLWDWDIVHDRIWATPECLALYGFAPGGLIDYQAFLMALHPDDRESARRAIQCALSEKAGYHCEYRVPRPDGTPRWIAAQGRGCFDPAGKPLRLMGVSIDVTPRKEAELEAQRQRQALAHTARAATLGELSAALAHELNQPLTAILSNAQAARRFLAQTPPDLDELRAILEDIVQGGWRAGEVVRRLRMLFKKGEGLRQAVDLNAVIREVGSLLHSELTAKQISLDLDLADGLPGVLGDPLQLQQVALNLLLNGAEAMASAPTRSRQLRVSTRRRGDDTLETAVRDTGPGIEPGRIESCFEPFVTSKPQGLGMGLAVSRSIIAAHGGRLWAANHPDGGAIFRFTLPVNEAGS